MKKKTEDAAPSSKKEKVIPKEGEEKKSKKSFILTFFKECRETNAQKAFAIYMASGSPAVSTAFFNKCWIEAKGSTPKIKRSEAIDIDTRQLIAEGYKAEEKLMGIVRGYRTLFLTTQDPVLREQAKKDSDNAMENVYQQNHKIRALMEKHSG
jgi:hypothetical protein